MSWKPQNKPPVSALRNLGPKSAMMLTEAGIGSLDELRELGAVKAYLRVKALRPKGASLNLLWAMAAGLEDRHWQDITPEEKTSLRLAVRNFRR
jgi:DNA transformation protein and related proteins